MKQAVIKLGGTQFLVSEGQTLTLGKINAEKDENLQIADVLAVIDGSNVSVGMPTLEHAKVQAKVEAQEKHEKIDVYKYKAKSRYKLHRGYRKPVTIIKIEKISETGAK